ncbi:MAG TPA: hypothetical protein VMF90_03095 [Rhizobiaceae bacterium]|nr:hypothetical protein [Rhizobiaceae bacterium]
MSPDFWTNLGILLAAVVAGLAGYYGPRLRQPPAPVKIDPVVAGIGLELGNRQQLDLLIQAVNRVADVLDGKKTAGIEETLKEILERMEAVESRQRPRRPR